ncbi:MAG: hypothetical protein KGZ59_02530 [Chitinophagaceae bacterium]|nr:hypothetical protein [Chitinophagaceae bacterium]
MKSYILTIKDSTSIQLVLGFGLLIQIVFCITGIGYFHPDQHFQIIEFSSLQLHLPNAANSVWELESSIRPTIQVYLFSGYRLIVEYLGVLNPFIQLLILRLIQGLLFWYLLNYIAFFYNKHTSHKNLIVTLLIINFSWFLPYSRTLFSSEITAALIFFFSIFLFHKQTLENKKSWINLLLIGFLIAISFYMRFQLGFAIAGFFFLIFFLEKKYSTTFLLLFGFSLGVALNVFIDFLFYQKIVFTPFLYFNKNIVEGVAASFGEKSFFYYLSVLLGVVLVPPISIILLIKYFKVSIQKFKHPIVISCLFFLIGHSMVAHKEERFLFTIINIIPIILSFGNYENLIQRFQTNKFYKRIIIFSMGLNVILLITFIFIPYSQSIHFIERLSKEKKLQHQTVSCFERNPLQTESKLPLVFYSKSLQSTNFVNFSSRDSAHLSKQFFSHYIISTYNDLRDQNFNPEKFGYQPILYSSSALWHLNVMLHKKGLNSINDIWVLFEKVN